MQISFEQVIVFIFGLLSLLGADAVSKDVPAREEHAIVTEVIDGDTIVVLLNGTDEERVRYIGIDTPEKPRDGSSGECYHAEATAANERLVANQAVVLEADTENRDQFGRLLRYVYVADSDEEVFVNKILLADGYASTLTIPPNTALAPLFKKVENEAQRVKAGLWGACS